MLSRSRKAMNERTEGFTLVELLVVMIIIGILAAIAIPVFLSQRQSGYDTSAKSDVHNAARAEESYFVDNQRYIAVNASGAIGTAFTKSGNTVVLSVTGNTQPAGGGLVVAADTGYVVAAQSKSGNWYCYESAASQKGVFKNANTTPTAANC